MIRFFSFTSIFFFFMTNKVEAYVTFIVPTSIYQRRTGRHQDFPYSGCFISFEGKRRTWSTKRSHFTWNRLYRPFSPLNARRFTTVLRTFRVRCSLNHRRPSGIRLQEMAWREIGEDLHRLQYAVRQIEQLG